MAVPQISVLMGVYDRRSKITLLKRSVSSILRQTVSDFEFIICDDGSTEQARSYLTMMEKQDSRIHLIRPGSCYHLAEKLNVCLQKSTGKLVARMDDDDYSFPERLEKQMAELKNNPEISFVGSNVKLYQNHTLMGEYKFPEFPKAQDFLFSQPYIHPTLMFRREALIEINGYSEKKNCILCEDYDLLLRLYARGCFGKNLQEDLLIYTISDTKKSSRTMAHRWNEAVTRYCRFKDLGLLPRAFPYVVKPLAVGLIPGVILKTLKEFRR